MAEALEIDNDGEETERGPLKKLNCNTMVYVGEVLDDFHSMFAQACQHINKKIQAAEFQNDIKDFTKRVLQLDNAMSYQC